MCLIPQTQVQGKVLRQPVVVLHKPGDDVGPLAPCAGLRASTGEAARQSEEEVRFRQARVLAAKADAAQITRVPRVVDVDAFAEELEPRMNRMLSARDHHRVVDLAHGAGEKLLIPHNAATQARCEVVACEVQSQQTGAGDIRIGDSQCCPKTPQPGLRRVAVVHQDVIHAEAEFVDDAG